MTTGTKRFSVGQRTTKRYTNEAFAPGKYTLVVGPGWEVRAAGENSKTGLRYVNGYFTVPQIGEGRRLYHMFFIDMSEGSDGYAMVDRGGGVTEFTRALGLEDAPLTTVQFKKKSGEMAECVNPNDLVKWLNSLEGTELQGQVKVEKDQNDPDVKRNRVDFFIEAEVSADSDDAGGLEADEDEEELEADEPEGLDEDEDEEPAPAPKKGKPAPKPALKKGKR